MQLDCVDVPCLWMPIALSKRSFVLLGCLCSVRQHQVPLSADLVESFLFFQSYLQLLLLVLQ